MKQLNDNQAEGVSIGKRFFSVQTFLAFGIAVALIAFLATRFDLDWQATWDNVRHMNPLLYVLAFVLYYTSFVFRGLRWRILARNASVHSSSAARLPSALQCSQLIVIGWFVNSITWLRLGDAYRAYAFSEDSGGGFSWSLGTILAERALDMAIVFSVLVISAIFLTTTADSTAARYILLAAFIMAVGLLSFIALMKTYGARFARFLPHRIELAYHRFHQGALGGFKQLPIVFVLGLAGWTLEMARLYFVVQALNLNIDLALVPVVALGNAILSTVPTPGGLGVVEPGMIGLLLLNFERHDAVSIALVDRSITYASVILVGGLVFVLRQIVRARRNRRRTFLRNAASHQGTGK